MTPNLTTEDILLIILVLAFAGSALYALWPTVRAAFTKSEVIPEGSLTTQYKWVKQYVLEVRLYGQDQCFQFVSRERLLSTEQWLATNVKRYLLVTLEYEGNSNHRILLDKENMMISIKEQLVRQPA